MKKLFLLLCLLMVGCATYPRETRAYLQPIDIFTLDSYCVRDFGKKFLTQNIKDLHYQMATKKLIDEINYFWMLDSFNRKYIANNYDCDDFARDYKSFAKNYAFRKYNKNVNLACFEFAYVTDDGTSHAVNIYFVEDATFAIVEPQKGKVYTISINETKKVLRIDE